jgi:hypothetical protein
MARVAREGQQDNALSLPTPYKPLCKGILALSGRTAAVLRRHSIRCMPRGRGLLLMSVNEPFIYLGLARSFKFNTEMHLACTASPEHTF